MTSIKDFFNAVVHGDLETVKHAIEQEGFDPNLLHPDTERRPIDYAAQQGHLDVIKYLVTQQARLDTQNTKIVFSFLYWVCLCKVSHKQAELLAWLHENDCYKELGDGIQPAHLAAAAGNNFDFISTAMHGGFTPLYYGVIVNNLNIPEEVLLSQLNVAINTGSQKGITLAWLLARNQQWDLLKTLAEKNSTPLNLNATPLAENHSHKGITLAWLLARNQQWNLLKTLAEKNSTPIDLNATPLAENHSHKGITLAWKLASHQQWDLLQTLAEKNNAPLLLDAAPLSENNISKGITLAWLLACYHQWDLLQTLAAKNNAPLDLNAAPLAENHPTKGITLAQRLITANQWTLLEKLLEKQCNTEDAHEKLTALIAQHPQQKRFCELVAFVALQHRLRLLNQALQNSAAPTPEIKEEITTLFNDFEQAPKDSFYYRDTQERKGMLLLELTKQAPLVEWVATQVVNKEIERYTRMNPVASATAQLKILAIGAYAEAGNGNMCALLHAEALANQATQQNQIQPTSVLLASENRPLPSEATANKVMHPPASKRRKISESEPANNAPTLFFGSPPAEELPESSAPSPFPLNP